MNFPAVRIEGSVLSADVLEEIATGQKKNGQSPADFGLDSGTKVKDDIAEAWGAARTYWAAFQLRLTKFKEGDPGTTPTRENWMVPLFEFLGYDLQVQQKGEEINRRTYPISHRGSARKDFPVHIAGWGDSLDKKRESGTGLRMSPHALVQEYLNLTEHLYALVTNGRTLRLLRDSSRLVRLSYVEFDLQRIFEEELFADFALLFRILHATRMPTTMESAADSLVEVYHQDSLESGSRIRDGLSAAVAEAIPTIANGFLAHPDNDALREAKSEDKWRDGQTTMRQPGFDKEFHGALLRLIYRILFLLVIEERGLVHIKGTNPRMRGVYRDHLSIARLRRLAEKRRYREEYNSDGWDALLSTFQLYEDGNKGTPLGIAPLGGLFDDRAIGMLAKCRLSNASLFAAFRGLGFFEHPKTKAKIRTNYGALNVEEFGSVYEGLLEVEAQVTETQEGSGDWHYDFQDSDARASSGSHYTPEELVQPLIKHSLDYLIEDRLKEEDPEKALLSLTVCDVACGSGHILLSAARRIAEALACHRTGEDQPNPEALRTALRDVIRHCIYGVDLNPLAVELCKVALWLEAHAPGEPLGFLDHKIKCGNAIVGLARQEELTRGIPDEAFQPLPDDEREVAAALRKRNKTERKGYQELPWGQRIESSFADLQTQFSKISSLPESTPEEIAEKRVRHTEYLTGANLCHLKALADIQVAQFYLPKTEASRAQLTTHDRYRRYLSGENLHPQPTAAAQAMAGEKRFFHWFIAFPAIFNAGGFSCILGNPPYKGSRKIRKAYGPEFVNWIAFCYSSSGAVDLVAYFVRRLFCCLNNVSAAAILTTNSIAEGVTREGGLELILKQGGRINFAHRSVNWPGVASVHVTLLGVVKGLPNIPSSLDGREVLAISSFLDDGEQLGEPEALMSNMKIAFQGTTPRGKWFFVDNNTAERLSTEDSNAASLIKPYLIGDDINESPTHKPGRLIIDFGKQSEYEASMSSPACFQHLRLGYDEAVAAGDAEPREFWWQFWRRREDLYNKLSGFDAAIAINRHSKFTTFALLDSNMVFSDATIVIAVEDPGRFLILNSAIHGEWAWKFGSTMRGGSLRYIPTRIFRTFAFPPNYRGASDLSQLCKELIQERGVLLQKLQAGLTEIYNLINSRSFSADDIEQRFDVGAQVASQAHADILTLRDLHCQMDKAVLAAYGWHEDSEKWGPAIDLRHDFYEVDYLPENDRVRYTIHPDARKEVLKRLLLLNHQRYDEEVAKGLHDKKTKKKAAKKAAQRTKAPDELI